jgi:hypothetical protein
MRRSALGTYPTGLAVRMMVMTLILGTLALVALVLAAPVAVTIPIATVLVLGVVIGGIFSLIDRHRSRTRITGGSGYASPARVLGRLR